MKIALKLNLLSHFWKVWTIDLYEGGGGYDFLCFFLLWNIGGLYLGVTRSCNLDVVHNSLTTSLLSNCGGLRTIYLSGVSRLFNDEFLGRLLQSQCLANLENIHVKEDVRLNI